VEILNSILPYAVSIATFIAGIVTGRKKQKNDFLTELQNSINLLAAENSRLVSENLSLKKEIIDLQVYVYGLERKGVKR